MCIGRVEAGRPIGACMGGRGACGTVPEEQQQDMHKQCLQCDPGTTAARGNLPFAVQAIATPTACTSDFCCNPRLAYLQCMPLTLACLSPAGALLPDSLRAGQERRTCRNPPGKCNTIWRADGCIALQLHCTGQPPGIAALVITLLTSFRSPSASAGSAGSSV